MLDNKMFYQNDLIISKLNKIEEKLSNIEESQKRQETHNTFITRLYFYIRSPLLKLSSLITGNDNYINDNELTALDTDQNNLYEFGNIKYTRMESIMEEP